MKNDFIIRGKEATLFVEAPPNVGYGSVEVKLDAADMDLVKSWPGTWFSFIHKSNGQLYIRATAHRVGGKVVNVPGFEQKQPLLHRVISKPERGQNTIFKDGNSLNLTRDTHVRVAVTNDTQRDAFRRHFSADERKELASVEADIKAIEVSQFKAREDLDAKKEALSCIRAKAQLQAAALTYLA